MEKPNVTCKELQDSFVKMPYKFKKILDYEDAFFIYVQNNRDCDLYDVSYRGYWSAREYLEVVEEAWGNLHEQGCGEKEPGRLFDARAWTIDLDFSAQISLRMVLTEKRKMKCKA